MKIARGCVRLWIGAVLACAIVSAQQRDPAVAIGGPLTGAPVRDAPFTADAVTTARLTLPDGTRLNQRTMARYYRDSAGRARVELNADSMLQPKTLAERHLRTVVAPDGGGCVYSLDPVTRTTRCLFRNWFAYVAGGSSGTVAAQDSLPSGPRIGGLTFGVPIPDVKIHDGNFPFPFLMLRRAQDFLNSNTATMAIDVHDERLGSQADSELNTVGRRVTMTIPAAELRNNTPFTLVDERWESAELRLLVSAHWSDSRMGEVDYRLSNVRRDEPPADLFVVPEDYVLDTTATPKEAWISLFYADRYPNVGIAYARTLGPRRPQ